MDASIENGSRREHCLWQKRAQRWIPMQPEALGKLSSLSVQLRYSYKLQKHLHFPIRTDNSTEKDRRILCSISRFDISLSDVEINPRANTLKQSLENGSLNSTATSLRLNIRYILISGPGRKYDFVHEVKCEWKNNVTHSDNASHAAQAFFVCCAPPARACGIKA